MLKKINFLPFSHKSPAKEISQPFWASNLVLEYLKFLLLRSSVSEGNPAI